MFRDAEVHTQEWCLELRCDPLGNFHLWRPPYTPPTEADTKPTTKPNISSCKSTCFKLQIGGPPTSLAPVTLTTPPTLSSFPYHLGMRPNHQLIMIRSSHFQYCEKKSGCYVASFPGPRSASRCLQYAYCKQWEAERGPGNEASCYEKLGLGPIT